MERGGSCSPVSWFGWPWYLLNSSRIFGRAMKSACPPARSCHLFFPRNCINSIQKKIYFFFLFKDLGNLFVYIPIKIIKLKKRKENNSYFFV